MGFCHHFLTRAYFLCFNLQNLGSIVVKDTDFLEVLHD
jgi:hypothetical protein